jgi:SOS-response transcriptional repressor LexA
MALQLRAIRERQKLNLEDIAERLGVAVSTISRWEKGKNNFPTIRLQEIAAAYQTSVAEIFGGTPVPQLGSIPIIGQVAAGNFKEAIQHPLGRMPVLSPEIPATAFALEVDGDSMDLYVPDGAYVVVDPDDKKLWPGWFYVVIDEDGETTFKEYQEGPSRLVPCSTNPSHREIELGSGEAFRVVGRVIWYGGRMSDASKRL